MSLRPTTRSGNGGVIHWAKRYDALITLFTLGREGALRQRMLDLARLTTGESVLDIGCGTGTLAISAKRRVGNSGDVHGIDASKEMITRARKKTSRAKTDVTFELASADALPFPDASFNVVLSTVMLHHLPRASRQQCLLEVRRVLTPGGRVLVVDFGKRRSAHRGLMAHFHRHGGVELSDLMALQENAGLSVLESGLVGFSSLVYVLGRATRNGAVFRENQARVPVA